MMKSKTRKELIAEMEDLKSRLQEAQEHLNATRSGEVDAPVVSGPSGEQVLTMKDADSPYRTIIEEMSEGTVNVSGEGVIVYSNRQFANMLGTPLSSLMGSSIYDHVNPSCRHTVKTLISRRKKQTKRVEVTFVDSGGELVHTYVSFSPLERDGTSIYCGLVTDITDERKARNDLQKVNDLLKRIFDSTHVMIAYMDRDFRFIRTNQAFCRACGKTWSDLEGTSFFELHPGAEERRIFRQVVQTGEVFSDEGRLFECFGSGHEPMYADWSLHPVRGSDAKVLGVVLSLVDRTQLKKLENQRSRLEKAIEQAGDGIIVTDPEGLVLYVNPAGKEISGVGRGRLLHKTLDLPAEEKGSLKDILAKIERDGLWKGHVRKRREDGTRLEIEATVAPVYDDMSNTLNYIVIVHDVTHELKREQQVRQMQKMEALGRLAGGIAHDLNNILYPIIINTEMLMEDTGPGTAMHQPLSQILTAAYRQRDLVKQILAFSRRSEQQLKPVRVAPIVDEALRFLRSSLPSTIEIKQEKRASSDLVMGDPAQIHQIVMSLCGNAADALDTRAGTITVNLDNVRPDASRPHPRLKPGTYLELMVKDTGQGMSREVMDRIFEPFFTTKGVKSSGMSLSVVHGIVEGLRGAVRVESRPGEGSTFTVLLPLIDEACQQRVASGMQEEPGCGKKQVMLVDDEDMVLGSVQRALERMGYSVTALKDGLDALDAFRKAPDHFDLIITDQTMPRMTGAELAEEVMHIRPDMPVILCTGFSEVISEQEAKEMGIRDLIMKPATTKDLGDSIHRVLNE